MTLRHSPKGGEIYGEKEVMQRHWMVGGKKEFLNTTNFTGGEK